MEKQKKRKRIVRIVSNILFFGLLLVFVFSTDAKSWVLRQLVNTGIISARIDKDATSSEAAAMFFADHAGQVMSTADLKGKVVFINFWATWCPPCRAEMPSLNKLYDKFKNDDRFVFLFINEDEQVDKAKQYLQSNSFTIPIHTRSGNVPAEMFSGTLPTTVVIDKEGKIVLKHEGLASYNTGSFIQQLNDLVK
ncbi:MAG TPA: TlpA disulfide reductase family protein [Flavisolibacter sp.]